MIPKRAQAHSGITMIELVVYIAILSVIAVSIVIGIIQLARTFSKAQTTRRLSLSAESAIERITREIRLACDITIDTSPPKMTLTTYASHFGVSSLVPCTTTRYIDLQSERVRIYENASPVNYLTPSDVRVTDINFTQLENTSGSNQARSKAVHVELWMSAGTGQNQVGHVYDAAAILGGSYIPTD
jgi:type II secretory pathway pseudopilin PulG